MSSASSRAVSSLRRSSRAVWSGHFADNRGPKLTVILGLAAAMASGVIYEVSLAFVSIPAASVSILLGGRALLGVAESFIITGA